MQTTLVIFSGLPGTGKSTLANRVAVNLGWPLLRITLAQAAPVLPYLLLVLIMIFRPKGLLGTRES